jgi:hypothetical protein
VRKGFATPLILIAFLVVILSGTAYLKSRNKTLFQVTSPTAQSTPSPDPYGGWKTYKNKTYGFTVRYPRNWHVLEYQDYAANFYDTDPKEATPGAIKMRFLLAKDKQDLAEFARIYNAKEGQEIREPLDVKSIITKIRNLDISGYWAVEYEINRNFTALEGPKTEYHHMYEIKASDTIMEFVSDAFTKEEQLKTDQVFQKMISSLKF